jgi:hypothetical protein
MNKNTLTGVHLCSVDQTFPGSDRTQRKSGSLMHRQALRLMGKQVCIHCDKFCQRTLKTAYAAHHAVDLIAGFESGDAATDLHHRARDVEAKNRRQRLLRMRPRLPHGFLCRAD